MLFPSGEYDTERTELVYLSKIPEPILDPSTSSTLTVLSYKLETTQPPLGENVMEQIESACPENGPNTNSPVSTLHTKIVPQ